MSIVRGFRLRGGGCWQGGFADKAWRVAGVLELDAKDMAQLGCDQASPLRGIISPGGTGRNLTTLVACIPVMSAASDIPRPTIQHFVSLCPTSFQAAMKNSVRFWPRDPLPRRRCRARRRQ